MEIYIIRHSIAHNLGANGVWQDHQRSLTEEGAKRAEKVGKGLRKLDACFDLTLSSPALRCTQTAAAVLRGMRLPEEAVTIAPELSDDAEPEDVLALLRERYPDAGQVALVGHQPGLSGLASMLMVEDRTLSFKMSRAGVICLQTEPGLEAGSASLLWKMLPGQLMKLAD